KRWETFRGRGNAKTNGGTEKRRQSLTIQSHEKQSVMANAKSIGLGTIESGISKIKKKQQTRLLLKELG
ncbi:hypothetical protein, partial [Segatella baroniae]|uniref:hypothetical protein n=1 Tax=Segatella baroniae TaxID=305719 RepID=UPI0028EBD759